MMAAIPVIKQGIARSGVEAERCPGVRKNSQVRNPANVNNGPIDRRCCLLYTSDAADE